MEYSLDEFPIVFSYFTQHIRHDQLDESKLKEFIKDKASLIIVGNENHHPEIALINLFYSIFAAFLINAIEQKQFETLISQSKGTQLFQFSPKCDPNIASKLIEVLKNVHNLHDFKQILENEKKNVFSSVKSLLQEKLQSAIKFYIENYETSECKEKFYEYLSVAMNINLRVWTDYNSAPKLYKGKRENRVAIDCDADNRVFVSMNASQILFKPYHFSGEISHLKYKDNVPVSKNIGDLYQIHHSSDLSSIPITNVIEVNVYEYCKECKSFASPDCLVKHFESIVKSKDLLPSAYRICLKMETQQMKDDILKKISTSIINDIIESKLNSASEYQSKASFRRVQNIYFELDRDVLSFIEAKKLLEVLTEEPESVKWKEAKNKLSQFKEAVFEAEKSASIFNELT
jgi:hypothetical protein